MRPEVLLEARESERTADCRDRSQRAHSGESNKYSKDLLKPKS